MNKTLIIIKREYFSRVRKKSFIVMTILGPILFALLMFLPVWLTGLEQEEPKKVAVISNPLSCNDSLKLENILRNTKEMKFSHFPHEQHSVLRKKYLENGYDAVVYNSDTIYGSPDSIVMLFEKQQNMSIKLHIQRKIDREVEKRRLKSRGLDENFIEQIDSDVELKVEKIDQHGETKVNSPELMMIVGYLGAILIYIFIFMYGAQVMRGVIEEKSNRIVEVIVSSVRPFELMMGKIVGIAFVAITQFMLWLVLSGLVFIVFKLMVGVENQSLDMQMQGVNPMAGANMQIPSSLGVIVDTLSSIPWLKVFLCFIFYFLGGYLMYASLFAAVGAAVDNETDTQQFMLPLTLPLILAFMLSHNVIMHPDGNLAFWLSIIPLTSPVIMMIRVVFDAPVWQLLLSMFVLTLTFIFTTWLAARIYRVGILMYGKKVSYKELWKWIKQSEKNK